MKKTIFAFILGAGIAVGGTVYGAMLFSSTSGVILAPAREVQIVPQEVITAPTEITSVTSKQRISQQVISMPVQTDEQRITALEARVSALEAKQK